MFQEVDDLEEFGQSRLGKVLGVVVGPRDLDGGSSGEFMTQGDGCDEFNAVDAAHRGVHEKGIDVRVGV